MKPGRCAKAGAAVPVEAAAEAVVAVLAAVAAAGEAEVDTAEAVVVVEASRRPRPLASICSIRPQHENWGHLGQASYWRSARKLGTPWASVLLASSEKIGDTLGKRPGPGALASRIQRCPRFSGTNFLVQVWHSDTMLA